MKTAARLLTCTLLLSSACRTTTDTGVTYAELAATRHPADLLVRAEGEPRAIVRIGRDFYAAGATLEDFRTIQLDVRGGVPVIAFAGGDVLISTGDVEVVGPKAMPRVQQTSRLWRAGTGGNPLFVTTDYMLGSFVSRGVGFALAIYFDSTQRLDQRFGTALLRIEDGVTGSMPLAGFNAATLITIDPVTDIAVVLGQRPAGDAEEWGLFYLEGVERRAMLFEARVVAPAFSADGVALAYAWKPDSDLARAGDDLHDGPFGRVSWIDRSTDAGRHIDTGLNVVACAFDPLASHRLLVLGRTPNGAKSRWQLLTIESRKRGLVIAGRETLP